MTNAKEISCDSILVGMKILFSDDSWKCVVHDNEIITYQSNIYPSLYRYEFEEDGKEVIKYRDSARINFDHNDSMCSELDLGPVMRRDQLNFSIMELVERLDPISLPYTIPSEDEKYKADYQYLYTSRAYPYHETHVWIKSIHKQNRETKPLVFNKVYRIDHDNILVDDIKFEDQYQLISTDLSVRYYHQ